MTHSVAILAVILCSVIEGFAQISLKKSTGNTNSKTVWICLGIALFAIEAILYTCALQSLAISTAYPLGALCFVVVTLLARWLLSETITPNRWIGIALIMSGCALIVL